MRAVDMIRPPVFRRQLQPVPMTATSFCILLYATACTSLGEPASSQTEVITSEPSTEQVEDTSEDSTSKTPPIELAQLNLGPTRDEELTKVLYEALKAQISETAQRGGTQTEPGAIDTFEFTIVKLTQGTDDVSSDPRSGADGIEVEISGWLQKTLPEHGDAEEQLECSSFDTLATLHKIKEGWALPVGHIFKFTREDAEDCY